MASLSRRDFLSVSLTATASLAHGADPKPPEEKDVHRQILALAAKQEQQRRARFAAVQSPAQLETLQKELRQKFLTAIGGLPAPMGPPRARKVGSVEGDDYRIEKLVFESLPDYFVSALLYRPKKLDAAVPGIISPCGHSTVGKAEGTYQTLHINLAKRGNLVLTYDPVGQGERSQFWDADRQRSCYNLSCGEHAVLGNPLYLLGGNLARYRIWDGMRAIDYLTSLAEVDPHRIGCVGNSGGGTLTAYIAALDPRVRAAAICCYITTLPRRMGNRIEQDPSADPEQDLFGFVGEGIDHAGLLALRVPRPTLIGSAVRDFFPIEGARESFAEAKKLYETAGAGDRIGMAEANERHGLTLPLRRAVYGWFERWLHDRKGESSTEELAIKPRPAKELFVCPEGQVNLSFHSRPLLPLALEAFRHEKKPPRVPLKKLLRLDPETAHFHLSEVDAGGADNRTLLLCVNGVEAPDWRTEEAFLRELARRKLAVSILDPRGVGRLRPDLRVNGHEYGEPLSGVEENLAYNAFLVGKSLLGMRVADVLAAVAEVMRKANPQAVVLCARRDAALTVCLAAAVEPAIRYVAVEEMLPSFLPLFAARGQAINAASVLPGMLREFGDIHEVLAAIAPRKVLVAGTREKWERRLPSVQVRGDCFTRKAELLLDWLQG
jgi:dienelactone hydrolase